MAEDSQQLEQAVSTAYDAVKNIGASDDFKLEGFKIVLKALLRDSTSQQSINQNGHNDREIARPNKNGQQDAGDLGWQKRIASKMDISEAQVEELYHKTEEGQLELLIEGKDLPKTNSKSTQQIAALISAGRQAMGLERATPLEDIRKVCDHYRVYDSKNFSSYLKQLGSKFRFEGEGAGRTMELTNGAFTVASAYAKKYVEA